MQAANPVGKGLRGDSRERALAFYAKFVYYTANSFVWSGWMPDTPVPLVRAKAYPLCLLLLGLAAAAFAPRLASASEAPSAGDSAAVKEARAALRKAIAFHREAKDLSLKFKASVYNSALDKQDKYDGKLLLKGAKFRLEIPGGTYVSDGDSYWEYHAQNHQVILKRAKDIQDQPLPGDVLLRFLDSDPISISRTKAGGKECLELRLDPSHAMKNLDSLAVLLGRSDFSVQRISSRDVSGNEAEYTVTSVKRNAGLKDGEFAFAIPKGTDVVDMRDQ
jgi:outer membrane lipoprotein carrier protein